MIDDPESCYRAVCSRDPRFDGWFIVAVTSTRIYCRPSCPARTPHRANMRFYPTSATAQAAGFRSCKRCRPDAAPGSPEWDGRADVVARAMRLIADGTIDREGVPGLALRLAYSPRQLQRLLVDELGAGPLALARAQRAQTARVLIETTDLPFGDVALAAGFGSIRQFNDTIRSVFDRAPGEMRGPKAVTAGGGEIVLRLPYRSPLSADLLFDFLALRAVPGIEAVTADGTYRRTLDLPHAPGIVSLAPAEGHVRCSLRLGDLRDLATAVHRCRRLLDLDADPVAVDTVLGADPRLAPLVAAHPGLRAPGAVDGAELAVRAVLGQQVSVAAARTVAGRLVAELGQPLPDPGTGDALTHLFPSAATIAEAGDEHLPMPASRRRAVRGLAHAIADGRVTLDPGSDRATARRDMLTVPGIGPWTASYIALRALGDPDVLLATDLGVRHALERLGADPDPGHLTEHAERWRPWRSYTTLHLWSSSAAPPTMPDPTTPKAEAPMTTTLRSTTMPSPVGVLTLVASDVGLRHVLWEGEHTANADLAEVEPDDDFPILVAARHQLEEYFAGERTTFDLPYDLQGTPFQRKVWLGLADIAYGTTSTYGEQATRMGDPKLARAVGAANGRNPLSIVLPCHRVIGSNGSLVGFAGGLATKRRLLDHEQGVTTLV